jgi:cell wall-associated NlpC family hydrolase
VSEDEKWNYIENLQDSYSGWIDCKQYSVVSPEYIAGLEYATTPITTSDISYVSMGKTKLLLPRGCTLPFFKDGVLSLDHATWYFKGEYVFPSFITMPLLLQSARSYLGVPYLWGGKTSFGIDCSGFTQMVYKIHGVLLPRDAAQQEPLGIAIPWLERAAGDIAYFQNINGKVIHVGILLDTDTIIHASGEVRIDTIDEKGIYHSQKEKYTHKLYSIKRVV